MPARKAQQNLYQREIVEAVEDATGPGWDVLLKCGHRIWCAVRPQKLMYCPECLHLDLERRKRDG